MAKILVITYYWPPDSGGGVQRVLKFCQYLKAFGHDPVVITRSGGCQPVADPSFLKETEGLRVIEVPYKCDPLKLFSNSDSIQVTGSRKMKPGTFQKLSEYIKNFIWLNLFVPDSKIGWYLPVRKKIETLLKLEAFDVVLSTGPPYTTHLVGLSIKKKFKLPWIADVRDPWLENPPYNVAYRFGLVKSLNAYLEKRVLEKTDRVVTVGENLARLLSTKSTQKKIDVIYNGFDKKDLEGVGITAAKKFRLGYYGNIDKHRMPFRFIKALAKELGINQEFAKFFKLEIYGDLTATVKNTMYSIVPSKNIRIHNLIPHKLLRKEYSREQVFLLLINNYKYNHHILTGKLFEYLYSGWPILGIGPLGGEAAQVLQQTGSGQMFINDSDEKPVTWLLKLFARWRAGKLEKRSVDDPRFNRRDQAKQLETIVHNLLSD